MVETALLVENLICIRQLGPEGGRERGRESGVGGGGGADCVTNRVQIDSEYHATVASIRC